MPLGLLAVLACNFMSKATRVFTSAPGRMRGPALGEPGECA